jgi:hypothetical protein
MPSSAPDAQRSWSRSFSRGDKSLTRRTSDALDASIVTWADEPEAVEWRQSEQTRREQTAAINS